ncbi:hypothetical protein F4804DRAFT_49927 [Jackrogersella minutella]|nr:hypothetical protein F4804DRAFT_49927 [Jackrogersella minutella]
MHPFAFIIAMSATALALPQPLPHPAEDLSDTIMDGLSSVLGTPNSHHNGGKAGKAPKCSERSNLDLASCINQCARQCAVDVDYCTSCIRECSSDYGCDEHHDGKKKNHDKDVVRNDDSNVEYEASE